MPVRTSSFTRGPRATVADDAGPMRNYRDLAPEMQQLMLALSILVDRISRLPHEHRGHLLRLLKSLQDHGDDLAERKRIHYAMEEIMMAAPVAVRSVDELERKPVSGGRGKLAAFIGSKIKQLREQRGMTQDQLAEKAGLRQSHVCRLEQGDHTPTRHTLEKVAKALGVQARVFDPMED
jgi:DNA-binding XRE family transcriptional regulator